MVKFDRFAKYVNKVYGLFNGLHSVEDGRVNPTVPMIDVLITLVAGILTRAPSLERMGRRSGKQFKNILTKCMSADTIGYALQFVRVGSLKPLFVSIVQKARRNKVFRGGTIDGFTVAALDGSKIYSTVREQEDKTIWKRIKNKVRNRFAVYAISLSIVGASPNLILNMSPIKTHEGEITAALRILRESYSLYTHYCDIVTMDALYAKAPIVHEIRRQNKHVVIRVKQENYLIIQDIDGLTEDREPDHVYENVTPNGEQVEYSRYRYDLKIWDEEGFTSWDSVNEPLRCLKIEVTRKEIINGEVVEETYIIYLVTTCPKNEVSPLTIWKIAHKRWDIENSTFHNLKTNWNFSHCFIHEPNAIKALWLLFCFVFNLFLLFYHRNLRLPKDAMVAIAEDIFTTIILSKPFWLKQRAPT